MKLSINDLVYIKISDVYANAKIIRVKDHEVTIRPLTNEEKQLTLFKEDGKSNKLHGRRTE
jgi:hypothetical protein